MAYLLAFTDNIDWYSLTKSEKKLVIKEIRKELRERIDGEKQIQTLVTTFYDRITLKH